MTNLIKEYLDYYNCEFCGKRVEVSGNPEEFWNSLYGTTYTLLCGNCLRRDDAKPND